VFSPRLASTNTLAGVECVLEGGGRRLCPGCSGGGGGEAHPSISVITCFWEPGHKVQMASMLSSHDQGKGPWILRHVVSGPWTSLVAVQDKGQCKIAVCGRHNGNEPVFPTFLHKSVRHGSYITIRAVPILASNSWRYSYLKNDSPCQRYGESPTLRISDTGSRRLPVSLIRGAAILRKKLV
jgi:hypothetical protein